MKATFGVWEKGQGWQTHDIADRHAKTMQQLLSEVKAIWYGFFDGDYDLSVTIYDNNGTCLEEFWASGRDWQDIGQR